MQADSISNERIAVRCGAVRFMLRTVLYHTSTASSTAVES
jgi:hypothetical protein